MNSVWLTSPFVKFNTDNLIYNETLCTETHFLNKFARDKYRTEDGNSPMNNERQGNFAVVSNCSSKSNLLSQEGAQDENIEENFTVTANGAACLKIDSKIASKKTKSRSTLSERSVHSIKAAGSSNAINEASNKIHEAGNTGTELSISKRTESINYSSKKSEDQLSAHDTTENNINNDLFDCPLELVEIYPGNKENISDLDGTFSDVSREESSLTNLPKKNKKSSRVPEDDAPPSSTLKCGQGDETCEHHSFIETASNKQCPNESKAVEDIEEKNETFKLSIVRDTDLTTSSDGSEKSRLSPKGKKRLSSARSRRVLKRSEELINCLDRDTKKMDCHFAIPNDSEYDETIPFVCESERTLMEDPIGMEKGREDNVISSSLETDYPEAEYPNESNENDVAKSRCDPFGVANSSNTDLLQRNSTVISANERKLGSDMESIKENLRTVTETREEEKNILNKIEMMRVSAKQSGGNQTSKRKITEYVIDDPSNGIIEKSEQYDVDYGNIKICNLLSKIHEQLYTNFQKMESIWILLQDTSPIDSVRSAMPLRLLIRIISKCKSYIHDSHDSYKAESKIAKCLFSLVIDLAKAVDQNKLVLEKQEWQLDSLLVKLSQEKNLYKKRLMMNEVISCWDHGLREISNIMQDISDKLRTVITESEEKENVRNPSFRRKYGVVESRSPKGNLTKKGSNVETQMSVTLNKHNAIKQPKSKTAMKLASTQRCQDVEKISYNEPLKIVERKMNDNISLSRYNATSRPKSKPSTKSLNIQRCQDVEKLSYNEPQKIVERKMNDNISLSRYNATRRPKSKPSTKSLNIQRCQDVEKLSYNEPQKIVERKMNDNISLSRYNATRRPKSKLSTKSLNIQRCQEKLSLVEPLKIVERKINDNVRHSEKGKQLKKPTQSVNFEQSRQPPVSRQKYRVANNSQPVWRPGGVVKLPSSSSATTLMQRNRQLPAQATERSSQLTDNAKEGRHGRSGESKKKISIDCSKQSSRRYITNPECNSKLKAKSRALKVCFKEENGSSCRSEKVLKLLEEIIKSPPADKKDKGNTNKSAVGNRRNETDPIDLERSMNPIPIEEEIEIPQDEPTRDIDPNKVRVNRSKHTEVFEKTQQLIEKIPECPLTVISPADFSSCSIIKDQPVDSKSSVHLENSQSRNNSNFTSKLSSSSIAEIESSNSHRTCTSSSSEKRQKNELSTSKDSVTVKAERHKDSSSVNVCSNSHTMSLTVLKEFLRDQGVDVGLLNRAEQCVKDKRKCRGWTKTKSASLADVITSNKQRDKCSDDSTESSCCRGDVLGKIVQSCERNSADLKDTAKSLDHNCKGDLKLPAPERKDTSTCTETNNNDSSVQTSLREMRTKSVQIIIEEDTPLAILQETMETQTEMVSTKHTATDCWRAMVEVDVMTESTSVKDSTTETVSYAPKLTVQSPDPKEEISDHCDKNATKFVEIWNDTVSNEMRVNDDQDLTEEHRHLERLNEDSSDKAPVCEQHGSGCELAFRESDSSTSSCCSHIPECCKHLNCWINPGTNNFDNFICTETIATLQSAAIRARNMYRAMYIYQQQMESKLKEEEEKKKFEKTKNCEWSKNLSRIDSIDVIVKDNYHSCKYNLEILSRAEIASSSDESEYETSESVSMPITTVSHNETDVSGEGGLEICKKSSSHAVLGVVKSLMEVLIQKMDDVKIMEIDSVRTVPCSRTRTCSEIHIEFSKKETEKKNEFSISPFTRQNLLMLVYGVVCSIVFWCLQFTITCDIVL